MPTETPTGRDVQRVARDLGLSAAVHARTVTRGVVRAYVDADDVEGNLTVAVRQSYADQRARRLAAGLIQAGWDVARNGSVVTVTASEPTEDDEADCTHVNVDTQPDGTVLCNLCGAVLPAEAPADPAAPQIEPRAALVDRLAAHHGRARAEVIADARDAFQRELDATAPALAAVLAEPLPEETPGTWQDAVTRAKAADAAHLRADHERTAELAASVERAETLAATLADEPNPPADAPTVAERVNPRTGHTEYRAYPYGRAHADGGAGPWTTDRDQAERILAVVTERAPSPLVPLTVTDDTGTTWHAVGENGDRLDVFGAARSGGPAHVRYRRSFQVTFPRYSRWPVVSEAMRDATLPHERLVTHSGQDWGGTDVTVTTELIFPSSSWCTDCGHDVRPDQYGRVSPYAVYRDPRGRSLSPTRNLDHLTAHRLAAAWLADADDGRTAHVGIDACG